MSLMGSLYVGVTGLQTSNNSLNTVAHNISNVNTEGYTRQQISQKDRHYNLLSLKNPELPLLKQVGLGVQYGETRQVRDYFLDKTYRTESGRAGFYEISADALMHVEDILKEANEDEAFSGALSQFWNSIQELAKDPSGSVTQGLFVSKAQTLLDRAAEVYNGIRDYQNNLNRQIKDYVDKINDYGKELVKLNDEIVEVEAKIRNANGIVDNIENANDLRDRRNLIVDQLSELVNVTFEEDSDGFMNVRIEYTDFVQRDSLFEISLEQDELGFYTPYWKTNAEVKPDGSLDISKALLFNLKRPISSSINTDIGKLKSLMVSRGDHYGTSDDLAHFSTEFKRLEDTYKTLAEPGSGATAAEIAAALSNLEDFITENNLGSAGVPTPIYDTVNGLTEAQQAVLTYKDKEYYDTWILPRTCTNVEAEFDNLIHGIVTKISEILGDAGYTVDGKSWTEEPYQDNGLYTLIAESEGYHIGNISVNPKFLQMPTLLRFVTDSGEADYVTAEKLTEAFKAEEYVLNPDLTQKSNFLNYYGDLVEQVTNSSAVARELLDAQTATKEAAKDAREQILGVSSDEELQFMITFQNAYNANSRYITTINTMLESIIQTFGS